MIGEVIYNKNGLRLWSEEEDTYLLEHQQDSVESLCDMLERPKNSIVNRLHKLKRYKRDTCARFRNEIFSMTRNGMSYEDIADEIGVARRALYEYMRRNDIPIYTKYKKRNT